jgi:RND family efflux transporter MFP subunit
MSSARGKAGRKAQRVGWVAVSLAALLGSSCTSSPPPAVSAASAKAKPAVEASSAPEIAPSDYIASGPLVVENQVELVAQRDGVISQILVDTGAFVKKGQVLGKFDDRQLSADRDAAAAKARSIEADVKNWEAGERVAQADLDRSDAMWKANIITKEQAEHAKYQHEATQFEVERERENLKYAQNTLRSLQLELEKTKIVAPFDGVVARRYARAGQEVVKNDRLLWISAVRPLRLSFTLSEAYLGRVKKGTRLVVTASAVPGESHSARVILVSPVVDPASDTIDVTAELEGPPASLRPGMTANVRLQNPR